MAVSKQVARLQARLEAIPERVREAVAPSLVQSANELAGMMRQLAPDDPATDAPDLKSSIAVTAPGQSTPPYSQPGGSKIAGPLEAVVTVGNSDVRYPHLLEYGPITPGAYDVRDVRWMLGQEAGVFPARCMP